MELGHVGKPESQGGGKEEPRGRVTGSNHRQQILKYTGLVQRDGGQAGEQFKE